jgi:hypothetical protein
MSVACSISKYKKISRNLTSWRISFMQVPRCRKKSTTRDRIVVGVDEPEVTVRHPGRLLLRVLLGLQAYQHDVIFSSFSERNFSSSFSRSQPSCAAPSDHVYVSCWFPCPTFVEDSLAAKFPLKHCHAHQLQTEISLQLNFRNNLRRSYNRRRNQRCSRQ